MRIKFLSTIIIFTSVLVACSGNGSEVSNSQTTEKPALVFNTPTLAPTLTPEPTGTPPIPTATTTLTPISATLKTQVNIRKEPNSESEVLKLLNFGSEVMVVGRTEVGDWLAINRPTETGTLGWIKAEYVSISEDLIKELRVITPIVDMDTENPNPSSPVIQSTLPPNTATTTAELNVRSGPASTFTLLGTIPANTTVTLRGKSQTEIWTRIEFQDSPENFGWVASKYLTGGNYAVLPYYDDNGNLIGSPQSQGSESTNSNNPNPIDVTANPSGEFSPALIDNDLFDQPGAEIRLGPADSREFQFRNSVSSPSGDSEDFIKVTPFTSDGLQATITTRMDCVGNGGITLSLFRENSQGWESIPLTCGVYDYLIRGESGKAIVIKISADGSAGEIRLVEYSLEMRID